MSIALLSPEPYPGESPHLAGLRCEVMNYPTRADARLIYADALADAQAELHSQGVATIGGDWGARQRMIGRLLRAGSRRLTPPSYSPAIKRIVKRMCYRKRALVIVPAVSVSLSGTMWDEGSRNTYCSYPWRRDSAPPVALMGQRWGNPITPTARVQVGEVIIQAGTFAGLPATMTIYCHPDDYPDLMEGAPDAAA